MSNWIKQPSEDKPGRIDYILSSAHELVLPAVLAVGLFATMGVRAGIGLAVLGFTSFLIAKLSLMRQRIWLSWGSRRMSPQFRKLYRLGYSAMVIGAYAGLMGLQLDIH